MTHPVPSDRSLHATLPIPSSSSQLQLRQAPAPQNASPNNTIARRPQCTITFKHPGYPDMCGQNKLLALFAVDHPNGGLHYGTAFLACAMVAGNARDGFFKETRNGEKVNAVRDHLLISKSYYFYVPDDYGDGPASSPEATLRYPVSSTFQHWSFPYFDLPTDWPLRSSGLNTEDEADDQKDYRDPPAPSDLAAYIIYRLVSSLATRKQ